ncbi:MAG: RNA-binding protein [Halobacteriovoraceae bacterium]|nr:RNA-binding protein [Halobacteriovoraceae bacterium]MCB9095370.1 RNA-binding protein [Halobacteriovoraceae bacterium]
MGNKLYVGNLPFSIKEEALSELFSDCGSVESARIITDRDTGRSKGFGFFEMSSDSEAEKVISKFNGHEFEGRQLKISIAKPQEKSGSFRSGGRGRY